ncbi:Gibberellin-regulated protein [Corchorus capsularis]|uniref:Gibberellin-regulated protein n=1 Tax=Corchorus capsularis TaxID=210143 RepID=A0A1R3GG96_COCAP|nr:Gibberellin-regulated protein [Corchorus capsularis]
MAISRNIAAASLVLFSLLLLHLTQAEELMSFSAAPSPSPLPQPIGILLWTRRR